MGESQSFNLSRWLQRLGFKRGDEPPIVFSVQPVQVVSDVSGLTPPYRPPSQTFGAAVAPGAGQFAAIQLQGGSPGGTFCRLEAVAGFGFAWLQTAFAPILLAAPTELNGVVHQEGTADRCFIGDVGSDLAGANVPQLSANAIVSVETFLPSGQSLFVQVRVPNVPISFQLYTEEFPHERDA